MPQYHNSVNFLPQKVLVFTTKQKTIRLCKCCAKAKSELQQWQHHAHRNLAIAIDMCVFTLLLSNFTKFPRKPLGYTIFLHGKMQKHRTPESALIHAFVGNNS